MSEKRDFPSTRDDPSLALRDSFILYCLNVLHFSERDVKQLAQDDRTFKRYRHDNIEGLVAKIASEKNKIRIKPHPKTFQNPLPYKENNKRQLPV